MVSGSRRDSVGGGGSSIICLFRGLQKPARFSGGGGGSRPTMNFPLMGPFYIFRLSQRGPRLNRPLLSVLLKPAHNSAQQRTTKMF